MKLLKKLLGIKTTYAIPSDSGVDITKGKKYKYNGIYIKDNIGCRIVIKKDNCLQINGGSWEIIKE